MTYYIQSHKEVALSETFPSGAGVVVFIVTFPSISSQDPKLEKCTERNAYALGPMVMIMIIQTSIGYQTLYIR